MILLTVIAVGLLSLSSISLRQSTASSAMAAAMANARLSLMLAIGDLQKEMGPDTRISVTADQIPKSPTDGSDTAAQAKHRQWTGVYESWPIPASSTGVNSRPSPVFRRWLVSGTSVPTAAAPAGIAAAQPTYILLKWRMSPSSVTPPGQGMRTLSLLIETRSGEPAGMDRRVTVDSSRAACKNVR